MVCSEVEACVVARRGQICLLIAVCLYGFTIVLMRYATYSHLGPLSFNAGRFFISAVVLVCVNYIWANAQALSGATTAEEGALWMWGTACGLLNFVASALLQIGLQTVNANKAGFILGMYVIFVPALERALGLRAQISSRAWMAVVLSVCGLYLLSGCAEAHICLGGGFGGGEAYCFVSMLFWVVSLICADMGSKRVDPIALTMANFVVAALLSALAACLLEPGRPLLRDLGQCWAVLLAVGVLQAGAFALTTVGQRYSTPTETALLLSLETVATCAVGYAVLGETLDAVELGGCALMLAATALATTDVVSVTGVTGEVELLLPSA
ncbi:hypothetical protein B484DRAFT_65921 [Ochromonadaceae sp. CCMP2298]|nr:hypothetical protein B484DRAFT_65921 [Ochromonadaceae sp. CCMP2298]